MFMFSHERAIWRYIENDTLEELKKSSNTRKAIFNVLTIDTNVISLRAYQDIAAWLLKVPEDELKKITLEDVIQEVGGYIDKTGCLI